jgi:hypothetical protein
VKAKKPTPLPLLPGDYYFNEQGLMVFTRQYHLRRGACCGSGCRHCPWQQAAPGEQEKENRTKK